jgi:hypothetical protein
MHYFLIFLLLFSTLSCLRPSCQVWVLNPVCWESLSSLNGDHIPICQIAHAYFQLLWLPFVPLKTFHRYLSINQEEEQYWDLYDFHSFFDLPFLAFKQKFNFLFYKFYKKILQKCSIFLNQKTKTKTKSHLNFILTSF